MFLLIQLKISKIQARHEFVKLHAALVARGSHGCDNEESHLLGVTPYIWQEVYPDYKTTRLLIAGDGVLFKSTSFNNYKMLAKIHILLGDLH
jgi:hypothetical protein